MFPFSVSEQGRPWVGPIGTCCGRRATAGTGRGGCGFLLVSVAPFGRGLFPGLHSTLGRSRHWCTSGLPLPGWQRYDPPYWGTLGSALGSPPSVYFGGVGPVGDPSPRERGRVVGLGALPGGPPAHPQQRSGSNTLSHKTPCHPSPQKQIGTPAQLREPTRPPLLYFRPVTRSARKTLEGAKREEGGENAVVFLWESRATGAPLSPSANRASGPKWPRIPRSSLPMRRSGDP